MLCPECGSDVGDTPSLCEKCMAARQAQSPVSDESSAGAALGSIRPNLKIVRLNKGQAAAAAEVEGLEGAAPQDAAAAEPTEQYEPEHGGGDGGGVSRGALLAAALVLLLGFFGLAGFLLKDQIAGLGKISLGSSETEDKSNLKEVIQIRVRPDGADLQGRSKYGYAIAGYTGFAFHEAKAVFTKHDSTLTLSLFSEFAKPDEPEMVVEFVFHQGAEELRLDNLLNFTTRVTHEGQTQVFHKLYSPKAIGLDVVPRLNGKTGPGGTIKMLFNGSEYRSLGSGGTDYSWKLFISLPLETKP